jgi:hypothetical protein
MQSEIVSNQRKPRIEAFICSATAITENKSGGTFTDNAGAGDFTITFTRPFARTPAVTVTPQHATSKLFSTLVSQSKTAVRFTIYTDAGVLTDPTSINVVCVGSDAEDQI